MHIFCHTVLLLHSYFFPLRHLSLQPLFDTSYHLHLTPRRLHLPCLGDMLVKRFDVGFWCDGRLRIRAVPPFLRSCASEIPSYGMVGLFSLQVFFFPFQAPPGPGFLVPWVLWWRIKVVLGNPGGCCLQVWHCLCCDRATGCVSGWIPPVGRAGRLAQWCSASVQ